MERPTRSSGAFLSVHSTVRGSPMLPKPATPSAPAEVRVPARGPNDVVPTLVARDWSATLDR